MNEIASPANNELSHMVFALDQNKSNENKTSRRVRDAHTNTLAVSGVCDVNERF